ncbi:MAG: dihydrofolate reductase [Mogibacterium sp.]|nr:dihydrofolate reductase [Mogibacterium sp.]
MNLIVAVDKNWGIGRDNGLLAHVPGDMKYFKEHTLGKVAVMGRKTLESMPGGKGLPGRTNIVLTGNTEYEAENCTVVHSEDELFELIAQYAPNDVWLIGGASMYNRYFTLCDKLYVTRMDADLNADAFIFNLDEDPNYEVTCESEPQTENGITYRFLVYERR